MNTVRRSRDEVERWLVAALAKTLGVAATDIDVEQPFADYGLDSVTAVELTGDLETFVEQRLAATILWDFPSITKLAAKLGQVA